MAGATKSILINASPEKVFDTITDYEKYPQFLPEVKGNEQRFMDVRRDATQCGEKPIWAIEQEDLVVADHFSAGTGLGRQGAVELLRKGPGERKPSTLTRFVSWLENADARRIGATHRQRKIRDRLQQVVGISCEVFREGAERVRLELVIRVAQPARQFAGDHHVVEAACHST